MSFQSTKVIIFSGPQHLKHVALQISDLMKVLIRMHHLMLHKQAMRCCVNSVNRRSQSLPPTEANFPHCAARFTRYAIHHDPKFDGDEDSEHLNDKRLYYILAS